MHFERFIDWNLQTENSKHNVEKYSVTINQEWQHQEKIVEMSVKQLVTPRFEKSEEFLSDLRFLFFATFHFRVNFEATIYIF